MALGSSFDPRPVRWLRTMPATKQLALVAIFAALIAIVTRLPGIPILGSGGKLQLSVILYPLIGILLGGEVGALAVLLGNFIAWIIPTSTLLGLLLIPPGALAAFVAGSLCSKERLLNWKSATIILAVLNSLWYVTPVGLQLPFYPIVHWMALLPVLLFRDGARAFIESPSKLRSMAGVGICSFAGLMVDSMAGNLIFIYAIGWVVPLENVLKAAASLGVFWMKLGIKVPLSGLAALFAGALAVTITERAVMTVVSTFLGSAVLRLLGNDRSLLPG